MLIRKLIALLSLLAISLSVSSKHLPDDIEPGDGTNEIQLPLTKETAAELIQVESNGKVLSVDEELYLGKILFRVKVLHQDGKIKIYRLDPQSGHHARQH
ncbi:MAG: hypothetical protein OEY48_03515 [Gammaproteobacteria bacterium]|nr:hypothetical protein [Gammaproteobacteria bacterium]MDH5591895.1 hypothetical protein [Gammaproteobacteria bacterium]